MTVVSTSLASHLKAMRGMLLLSGKNTSQAENTGACLMRSYLATLLVPCALSNHAQKHIKADIRADTNRDGFVDVTGDSDVHNKTRWTENWGAVILPNIGDTDRRCSKIALSGTPLSNAQLEQCHDASDDVQRAPSLMARIRTVPIKTSGNISGTVSITNRVARSKIRIFRPENKDWTIVHDQHRFTKEELAMGLDLGVDARDTRRPGGWDGRVMVTFTVETDEGIYKDRVALRVAPVLTHHHLQKTQQVLAVKGNETICPQILRFTQALSSASEAAGFSKEIHLFEASDDIWAQDFMEPGYASMPVPHGVMSIRIMIRSPQDERVGGRQVFEHYRRAGIGAVQHLGGSQDEINSGGNIEAIPPYTFRGKSWPAGRVILGNHGKQKHHILPYLRAQETQDPLLLDTDWLEVGHVDEFLQFLPANNERGWIAMVEDPLAGIALLQDLQGKGYGYKPSISRKNDTYDGSGCNGVSRGCDPGPVPIRSINSLLEDKKLMNLNRKAAKRIDGNIAILKREVGLRDEDFLRIPALFQVPSFGRNDDKVRAYFPGVVNSVVLSGYRTVLAPNPWGPMIDGEDVLGNVIRAQYAKVGMNLTWIDAWNSHHNFGGEVHGGTNTIRDMSAPWWKC